MSTDHRISDAGHPESIGRPPGLRHLATVFLAVFLVVAPFVRRHGTLPDYGVLVAIWSTVCLSIVAVVFALSGGDRIQFKAQDRAVAVFTVVAVLGAAWGMWRGAGAQDVAGDFLPFPVLFAFYCAGRWLFTARDRPASRQLAVLLLACYVINTVVSLFEFIVLGVGATHGYRLGGILLPRLNPGYTPALIFFLGLLLTRSKDRTLALSGLTAAVLMMILSLGRSHWVGIAAAVPVAMFAVRGRTWTMVRRYSRALAPIAFAGFASLFLATLALDVPVDALLAARASGSTQLEAEDVATRLVELQDGIGVALQNPLGIGLGGRIYTYVAGVGRSWTQYLHNTYVEVWLKLGIAGLIAIVWISLLSLKQSYTLYRATNQPVFLAILLGLFAIYVGTNFSPYTNKIFGTAFLGLVLGSLQTDEAHFQRWVNDRQEREEGLVR
jgi:O-antigen ligase